MKYNKKQNSREEKYAFSLAEALITLLIVCLITLASIPILTKKKRDLNTGDHGYWMCSLDDNGNAVYASKTTDGWTQSGSIDSCTFYPPINARNFEITIVGGGGGGAAGNSISDVKELSGENTQNFIAPGTGSYEIYLIGGGASGGKRKNNANRCQENPGGPGGSGGFSHRIINLEYGASYTLASGKAGSGASKNCGDAGGDSYIKLASSDTRIAEATGGNGGQSMWKPACGDRGSGCNVVNDGRCHWAGCPGRGGAPNGKSGWTIGQDGKDTRRSVPPYLCSSYSRNLSGSIGGVQCATLLKDILKKPAEEYDYASNSNYSEYTTTRYGLPYGYGGKGQSTGQTSGPTPGGPGYLRLSYFIVHAGGGGKSGYVNRPAVVPSLKRLIAYPGKGGLGATAADSNGSPGESTTCTIEAKDYTSEKSASRGTGGIAIYNTAASAEASDVLAGQEGETSPVKLRTSNAIGGLGGFQAGNASEHGATGLFKDRNYFGAGGGGGGANSEAWGKGGNGNPGAVIVEW